jgi:MFS family permease
MPQVSTTSKTTNKTVSSSSPSVLASLSKPRRNTLKSRELRGLIQAESLLSLSRGLVSIFVPIYLWQSGYRLAAIAIFFAIERLVRGLVIPLAGQLAYRLGPQRVLAISYPLQVAYYIALANSASWHLPYYTPAIILGMALGCYWVGYHIDLSLSRSKNDHGRDVGTAMALSRGTAILAPAISALIASRYGFGMVFWLAAALALFGSALVWRQPEPWREKRLKYAAVLRPSVVWHALGFSFAGFQSSMALVAWPLYVFLVVGSFREVGFAATAAAIGPVVAMWLVSRIITRQNRPAMFRIGRVLSAVLHLVRLFVGSIYQAVALSITDGIASPLMDLPMTAEFYHRLREFPRIEYVVVEEVSTSVVGLVGWSAIAIIAAMTDPKQALRFGFVLAALATMAIQYRNHLLPTTKNKK